MSGRNDLMADLARRKDPMTGVLRSSLFVPKLATIMDFIKENRIDEFRMGVLNSALIGSYSTVEYSERDIEVASKFLVPYAKELNPEIDVGEWLKALDSFIKRIWNTIKYGNFS